MNRTDEIILAELYLDRAGFRDKWGEPLNGVEAFAALSRVTPEALEKLETEFFSGDLQPEEYVSGIQELIERVKREKFLNEMDRQLASLRGTA